MGRVWEYRHTVLATYTLSYFATRVEPLVVGPLVPEVTAALGTTQAAIGAAMTGLWAAYAIVQIPSGVLADVFDPRSLVVGSLLLGGIGSLLLAIAPSILVFGAVAVLLGGGLGLYYNVGVLALSDRFPETGRALGIHRVGAQAAGLVVPVVAVTLAARFGWRVGLLLGAVVALPTAALVTVLVDPVPPSDPAPSVRSRFDRSLLTGFDSGRSVGYATALAGIGEFVAVTNFTFLPTFLVVYHGIGSVVAGTLFSLYFLAVSATHPIAGWLADRYRPDTVVAAALAVGVVSHGLLVVAPTPAATVLVGVAGLTMGYNIPLQTKLLGTVAGDDQGRAFGVFRTAYVLIGSLGGVVVGSVADAADWAAAYGLIAGLLLVGLSIVIGARVRTGGDGGRTPTPGP